MPVPPTLRPGATLFAGYACLLFAWAFATPAGSYPDEWAHYLRALAASEGSLIGKPVADHQLPRGMSELQLAYLRQTSRVVSVPEGREPAEFGCNAFKSQLPASCLDQAQPSPRRTEDMTVVGTYQPAYYLLAGLVLRAGGNAVAGTLAVRAATVLLSLALLAFAIRQLGALQGHGSPWVGLIASVTPAMASLLAALNPSALELAAGVASFAAGLRLLSDPLPSRWDWAAFGLAGAGLVVSRVTGPIWLAGQLVALVVYRGPRLARERLASNPRAAAGVGLGIGVALGLNRLWEAAHGAKVKMDLRAGLASLPQALRDVPHWLEEAIGGFQYLDTVMPSFGLWLGEGALALLAAWALLSAPGRQRLSLLVAALWLCALPLALDAFVVRRMGFPTQSRYFVALTCGLPLLAWDAVMRHARAQWRRWLVPLLAVLFGAAHVIGWYASARRSAVGTDGPWLFLATPAWSPPWGWWPWLLLAFVGAALLAAAAALQLRAAQELAR